MDVLYLYLSKDVKAGDGRDTRMFFCFFSNVVLLPHHHSSSIYMAQHSKSNFDFM